MVAKNGPVLAQSPNLDASHIQSSSISSFIWLRTQYPVLRLLNHCNLLAHHIALGIYEKLTTLWQEHNCTSCLCLEECINDFLPIDIFDGEVLLLAGSRFETNVSNCCEDRFASPYRPFLMHTWCGRGEERTNVKPTITGKSRNSAGSLTLRCRSCNIVHSARMTDNKSGWPSGEQSKLNTGAFCAKRSNVFCPESIAMQF